MSIDFRDLDSVIEKLQKKSIGGGSPPEMLDGHLVLWRTLRGFRVAFSLQPGAGEWSVQSGGKSYVQGKILVGPPSLVGQNLRELSPDVWNKLSGSGTKETFSSASPEGIKALKSSIKNSLKSDDTRVAALETNELPKLVQIARSAGFTDSETKAALGGKVFSDAIGGDVVSLDDRRKAPAPEVPPIAAGGENDPTPPSKPDKPNLAAVPDKPADRPTPETPPTPGKMTADGAVAPLIDALKIPGIHSADKKRAAADRLAEAAKGIKDQFLRAQITALANGLRTNDFKVEDVKDEIRQIIQHRRARLIAQMSAEDMDKLSDKAAAKDAVREIKAHVEAHPNPTPEQSAEYAAFYVTQLEQLVSRMSNPTIVTEIKSLIQQVRNRRIAGNSVVLRVLQILRLILAFIPG